MPHSIPRYRTPPHSGVCGGDPCAPRHPHAQDAPRSGSVGRGPVWPPPAPPHFPPTHQRPKRHTHSLTQSEPGTHPPHNQSEAEAGERAGQPLPYQPIGARLCPQWEGGRVSAAGATSLPKMSPAGLGGAGLQVQGCAVGAGGQDVGDVLSQEAGPVDWPAGRRGLTGCPHTAAPPKVPSKMGVSPSSSPSASPGLLLLCGRRGLLALAAAAAGGAALRHGPYVADAAGEEGALRPPPRTPDGGGGGKGCAGWDRAVGQDGGRC